jgi:hypothetical protein
MTGTLGRADNRQGIWRRAEPADIAAVGRLSRLYLGDYAEEDFIFDERRQLCPEGCHVLSDGTAIGGYMISHPWRRADPPALNHLLDGLPTNADCWYIHDVAIDTGWRGSGGTAAIVAVLDGIARAADLRIMALVAVAGADGYWQRLGFRDATTVKLRVKLAGYGADARYMERRLDD